MKPRRFIWEEFLVWCKFSARSDAYMYVFPYNISDIFIKVDLRDFYE